MLSRIKFVIEQHEDGFVAYPLGVRDVIIGQGGSADEALADARSALRFHIETFGRLAFDDAPVLDAFIAEDTVTL